MGCGQMAGQAGPGGWSHRPSGPGLSWPCLAVTCHLAALQGCPSSTLQGGRGLRFPLVGQPPPAKSPSPHNELTDLHLHSCSLTCTHPHVWESRDTPGRPGGLLATHGRLDHWSRLPPDQECQLQLQPGRPGGLSSESCLQTASHPHPRCRLAGRRHSEQGEYTNGRRAPGNLSI